MPKVKEFCHFILAGRQAGMFLKPSMHEGGRTPVALGYQLARRRRTITLGTLGTHFSYLGRITEDREQKTEKSDF